MFGKRRVHSPVWDESFWKWQSTDCLCCPRPTDAAPIPGPALLLLLASALTILLS